MLTGALQFPILDVQLSQCLIHRSQPGEFSFQLTNPLRILYPVNLEQVVGLPCPCKLFLKGLQLLQVLLQEGVLLLQFCQFPLLLSIHVLGFSRNSLFALLGSSDDLPQPLQLQLAFVQLLPELVLQVCSLLQLRVPFLETVVQLQHFRFPFS